MLKGLGGDFKEISSDFAHDAQLSRGRKESGMPRKRTAAGFQRPFQAPGWFY
jgi:hypothetical protein